MKRENAVRCAVVYSYATGKEFDERLVEWLESTRLKDFLIQVLGPYQDGYLYPAIADTSDYDVITDVIQQKVVSFRMFCKAMGAVRPHTRGEPMFFLDDKLDVRPELLGLRKPVLDRLNTLAKATRCARAYIRTENNARAISRWTYVASYRSTNPNACTCMARPNPVPCDRCRNSGLDYAQRREGAKAAEKDMVEVRKILKENGDWLNEIKAQVTDDDWKLAKITVRRSYDYMMGRNGFAHTMREAVLAGDRRQVLAALRQVRDFDVDVSRRFVLMVAASFFKHAWNEAAKAAWDLNLPLTASGRHKPETYLAESYGPSDPRSKWPQAKVSLGDVGIMYGTVDPYVNAELTRCWGYNPALHKWIDEQLVEWSINWTREGMLSGSLAPA